MTDTADIGELVERLEHRAATKNGTRVGASDGDTYTLGYYDNAAASDDLLAALALTALEAENKALREVLGRFSRLADNYENSGPSDWVGYRGAVYVSDLRAARRAIKGDE